ncbi:MAG TPA: AMP-binding protein [Acidimicrobiales bacterium]|nr:AMP-binding protein [Acidimicrobiales bacterium]
MTAARRWELRTTAPELAERYVVAGWWTDDTLGSMVADGLASAGAVDVRVHSAVRPWAGTIGNVDRAARALAAALQGDGVGQGDVVALQLPNWVEAAITFWAAAYLGATVVPVVHFYGPKEIGYILDVTDPAVVVTPDRFGPTDHLAMYEHLLADRPGVRWLVAAADPGVALPTRARPLTSLLDGEPLAALQPVDPAAPALVAFTSGTTSNPKGVIHSHRTIGCETRQLEERMPGGGPPLLVGAPVGHFIGMLSAFLVPLIRGEPIHMVDAWDPGNVLRLLKEHGLAFGGGATYFLTSLLDHPDFTEEHLAHMPTAGLGGSAVPAAVTQRATNLGITAFRAYGSTEHPSITGGSVHDPEAKRLHTDGRPAPGVEIQLTEEGEILSRGPDLCVGYTDPSLTAQAFDADGWYHTGDVGVLDDDGFLSISDRLSDIVIRGGENISAQEIEELVLRVPGVAEVAVVAAPDERLGEHAAAILRIVGESPAPSLDDLRAHLAGAGLAKQKWPESLYVVPDFPRTASGKIQKFKVRQQLRDGELA